MDNYSTPAAPGRFPYPGSMSAGAGSRWRLTLLAVSLTLLGGCAPPGAGENTATLLGVHVRYLLRDARDFGVCSPTLVGCTLPLGSECVVQLDRGYFERGTPRQRVGLVAHEVGHCLDLYRGHLTHGGFRDQGLRWGPYYRSPAEGYAEAFSRAYLARCGLDLASLGWQGARGSCVLPDPRLVTPGLIERLGL